MAELTWIEAEPGQELTPEQIANNEAVLAEEQRVARERAIEREHRRQQRLDREREAQREEERRYQENAQRRMAEIRVQELARMASPSVAREGMVISALPNSLWRVERRVPTEQTGYSVDVNPVEMNLPPIYVTTDVLASELTREAAREGITSSRGSVPRLRFENRPAAKIISIAFEQSRAVTLTVELAAVNRNIWVMPGVGVVGDRSAEMWKQQWAPWIKEVYTPVGPVGTIVERFLIPIELPRRRWTATMSADQWGRGFTEPELYFPVTQTRRGVMTARMGRWLGGNHGSDLAVCWGQSTRQNDPLTTFESFDSLFFDSTFNRDLQYNRTWGDSPRAWGLEPVPC